MADKTELDKAMQDAKREFQKENPGQTLSPKQLDAMRSSIEKNLTENNAIRTKSQLVGTTLFTTLNTVAVSLDGAAMYSAGAKGGIPGQVRSYGWDLVADSRNLGSAGKTVITDGLLASAGRSGATSTLRTGGAVLGRLSIPLTVALGAYETVHNYNTGNRKGAYEAGTGTALSLGASIAAGAAVGTMVTPLVGTIVGAVVGVAGYYGGRYLGGAYADATDAKKDFKEAAAKLPTSTPSSRLSVSLDPQLFKGAPASQTAFSGAVKPAGVDVTKVATPNAEAANEKSFKKTAQTFTYG
ncbi:MAG: Tail tape measure protein core region [Micavibrio sp.]|nr:Tail tape measure protein core region [Micavibrio sp.]